MKHSLGLQGVWVRFQQFLLQSAGEPKNLLLISGYQWGWPNGKIKRRSWTIHLEALMASIFGQWTIVMKMQRLLWVERESCNRAKSSSFLLFSVKLNDAYFRHKRSTGKEEMNWLKDNLGWERVKKRNWTKKTKQAIVSFSDARHYKVFLLHLKVINSFAVSKRKICWYHLLKELGLELMSEELHPHL